MTPARLLGLAIIFATGYAPVVCGQGTAVDYERANGLRATYEGLVANLPGPVTWIENTHRFWYRTVGEMDNNVDPSSTMQVVNQLIKHDKDFDLLYIPGAGHGPGGAYGEHKRFDFFVRELLGVTPPAWTKKDHKASTADREFE